MLRTETRFQKRNKAFTLVEVLFVLVLLGIITALSAPHFRGFLAKQQLINGVTFVEGTLQDSFSRARSEQMVFGLRIEPGMVHEVSCPYEIIAGTPACGTPRLEKLLLWDGKPVLETLNLTVDRPGEILFAPPHGDILPNVGFLGDPLEQAFVFTNKLGEARTLSVYQLSGLINVENE